jgi:hypothetical protein
MGPVCRPDPIEIGAENATQRPTSHQPDTGQGHAAMIP